MRIYKPCCHCGRAVAARGLKGRARICFLCRLTPRSHRWTAWSRVLTPVGKLALAFAVVIGIWLLHRAYCLAEGLRF